MRIKKIAQSLLNGLIFNSKTDSSVDTYSCSYIDNIIDRIFENGSITDLNTAIKPGMYSYYEWTQNRPAAFAAYGTLIVLCGYDLDQQGSKYVQQILIGNYSSGSTPRVAIRTYVNFDDSISWTNWEFLGNDIYSTEERIIGQWTNGKPLYRKMFDYGLMPSNNVLDKSHGIPNIEHVHINLGESFWYSMDQDLGTCWQSFSFVYNEFISNLTANNSVVAIKTNSVDADKYKAAICLEYTKTTD